MKFKKKPVEIEAVQYNGVNQNEIIDFTDGLAKTDGNVGLTTGIIIPTLEGNHLASVGDWIIKGVSGEFYLCKPNIFKETYEPVNKFNPQAEMLYDETPKITKEDLEFIDKIEN